VEEIPLSVNDEETVVGVHSSGIELQEGLNTSNSRYYCSNCKKKIHCYVKIDKDTKEAIIHNTCKSPECECKCKTHYACKECGHLHPYGDKCNRPDLQIVSKKEADDLIEKINKDYNDLHKGTKVESK